MPTAPPNWALPSVVSWNEAVGVVRFSVPPKSVSDRVDASIAPVRASSTQSPPRSEAPVRSVEAATSAPVAAAMPSIRAAPSEPSAASQP